MRKKITVRVLISIFMHLLIGAAFVIMANLLIRSDFTINYLDDEVTYVPSSAFAEEYEFEESDLYTEIYTRQLQDIITYCAIKNVFEKNDKHISDTVNILDFDYSSNLNEKSGGLVYNIDDLIKWGRSGFTYTFKEFTVEEFMSHYSSPYSFDDILYHSGDDIYYYVNDDGQTIVSVKFLDILYPSVNGITSFDSVADNWISFIDIQNALKVAAEKYVKYYDMYRNGVGIYEFTNINTKYVLRIGEDRDCTTYTNIKNGLLDYSSFSDDELTEIISDYKGFLVYYPDNLEYSTFSNVKESDLYIYVRLYADEYEVPIKLWAYVEGDYTKNDDAFSIAYNATSGRKGTTYRSVAAVSAILVIYVVLVFFMALTAGVKKKGEYYFLFFDRIFLEVYAALLAASIIVSRFAFAKNYSEGISDIYGVFLPLGIVTSFSFCSALFTTIRRIRGKSFKNLSLFYRIFLLYQKIRDRIENHHNAYFAALVPFHFYFAINFFLFVIIVMNSNRDNRWGIFIPIALMVLVNVLFAIRQIRKTLDRNALIDGIKRISGGDIDFKIDNEELLNINKDLADNINHIGDAYKQAVNTSLKDEKMKSDLITNVSHDLKTPLTSIINYVNLLQDENIDREPAAGYIRTLEEKSIRLKQLLIDLIDASRLSSGTTEVSLSEIKITELLHQIIAEFSDKLEDSGLEVIFDGESKASIMADGRHMWRLMDNIFENVCKYSLKGTRVYVSVRELVGENSGKILISVKNVSAAPNTLQGSELTERFIRGDSSRSSEGSGLGLYIAKSLTELQNGSFEVIADGDLFKVDIIFDILKQ